MAGERARDRAVLCKQMGRLLTEQLQSNLINMNSTGPSKKVHIKRNFTLTVVRCMGVIIPGDFKEVHTKCVRINEVSLYPSAGDIHRKPTLFVDQIGPYTVPSTARTEAKVQM